MTDVTRSSTHHLVFGTVLRAALTPLSVTSAFHVRLSVPSFFPIEIIYCSPSSFHVTFSVCIPVSFVPEQPTLRSSSLLNLLHPLTVANYRIFAGFILTTTNELEQLRKKCHSKKRYAKSRHVRRLSDNSSHSLRKRCIFRRMVCEWLQV